jgi:adenylate kinase family enzyme
MARFDALLLVGLPGSGKGTQSAYLASSGFTPVSAGALIRAEPSGTPLGQRVSVAIADGSFIADEDVMELFDRYVAIHGLQPGTDTLLLDGFPPRAQQVPLVLARVNVLGIIFLAASDPELLLERTLLRAERPYERDETLARARFARYSESLPEMLACFAPELVHRVDATGTREAPRTVEDVRDDIARIVREIRHDSATNY